MGFANKVFVAIACEKCDESTPKSLAWLAVHNHMPCGSCGASIDLSAGENGLAIQKLANQCADIDASMAKRS